MEPVLLRCFGVHAYHVAHVASHAFVALIPDLRCVPLKFVGHQPIHRDEYPYEVVPPAHEKRFARMRAECTAWVLANKDAVEWDLEERLTEDSESIPSDDALFRPHVIRHERCLIVMPSRITLELRPSTHQFWLDLRATFASLRIVLLLQGVRTDVLDTLYISLMELKNVPAGIADYPHCLEQPAPVLGRTFANAFYASRG